MTYLRCGILFLALSLGTAACSSSSQTSDSNSPASSDRIVVGELPPTVQNQSVYDVINEYNSHWLRKRGPSSFKNLNPIQVYFEGSGFPVGTTEKLKDYQASNIAFIKYFNGQEAQHRFGMGNVSGAILLKRGSSK